MRRLGPVALLHGYSRDNRGDGLLVDLSMDRLQRAGVTQNDVTLFALDAQSFGDLPQVRQVGTPSRTPTLRSIAQAIVGVDLHQYAAAIGVGGGYIRVSDIVSATGFYLNHSAQMSAARTVPSIYLPVSVGPLKGAAGRRVKEMITGVQVVCVRDEASADELGRKDNVYRIPDLAVLDIAERPPTPTQGDRIAVVARPLANVACYRERLEAISALLPDALWAVQVDGSVSKSDRAFYRRLGVSQEGTLDGVLGTGEVGVVLSVRLHGALGAIRAGVPAIHLSYGRKGLGAYRELGLEEYVHEARGFDPHALVSQTRHLADNPGSFWRSIDKRHDSLIASSTVLDELVAGVIG